MSLTRQNAKWMVEQGILNRYAKYLACGRILTTRDEYFGEPGEEQFTIARYCRLRNLCQTCGVICARRYAENRLAAMPPIVGQFVLKAVIRFRRIDTPEQALRATQYLHSLCVSRWSGKMRNFAKAHGGPEVFTERLLGIHFGRISTEQEFLQPHLHLLAAFPSRDLAAAFRSRMERWIADANSSSYDGRLAPQLDVLQDSDGIRRIISEEKKNGRQGKTISVAHFKNLLGYVSRLTEEGDELQYSDNVERDRRLQEAGMKKTIFSRRLGAGKAQLPNRVVHDPPLAVVTLDGYVRRVHSHQVDAVERWLRKQTKELILARMEQRPYAIPAVPTEWLVSKT